MSEFSGTFKEEEIQDSEGGSYLAVPAIDNGKFIKIGLKEINDQQCAVFTFKFTEGAEDFEKNSISGIEHEIVEWPPEDEDVEDPTEKEKRVKKNRNKKGRIGYILKYIFGEATVKKITFSSWEDLLSKLEKANKALQKKGSPLLTLKTVANVYNPSKHRIETPNYKGFLTTPDSSTTLSWSPKERSDIQTYLSTQAAVPTNDQQLGSPDNVEDPFGDDDLGGDDVF